MRRALIPVLALAATRLAAASPPDPVFVVLDRADPREISEATEIFVNGQKIAHFELDAAHRAAQARVTVPAAAAYSYALCGRITIRRPDGAIEQHVVDGGGQFATLDGRHLVALAAEDFQVFYLADETDPSPAPPRATSQCPRPEV